MPNFGFNPKRSEDENLADFCPFPKHKGRTWEDVINDDPRYVKFLFDEGILQGKEGEFLYEKAMDRLEDVFGDD